VYLKEIRLYNWRKYKTKDEKTPALVVPFKKGLNILIGENDSGKTGIIDAIRMVLGTNNNTTEWITDEDFSEGAESLVVECKFDDLSPKDEAFFLEWLTLEGEKLEKSSLRVVLRANKYKDANQVKKLSREIVAGPENHEQGMNSIAQEYLRVTYLKPLRDAASELKPGYRSRVAKVIEGLEAFQSEEKKKEVIDGFETAFEDLAENLKEPVLDKIDGHLRKFLLKADNRGAHVSKKSLTFSEVLRRLDLSYDDIKSGLGSTNILFMALELIALRKQEMGAQITLIEEIEAHLHPQAQLRVIKAFENHLEENEQLDGQFILTTHSPTLAASAKLENLILIFNEDAYPMGCEYTKLSKGDYKFLNRFMDATKANLFFAKGVILVEGFAENILVPAIAEAIGRPLHQYGVSVVNVQNTQFNRYLPIFLRKEGAMNFPVSVITDTDISPKSHYIPKEEEEYENLETPATLREIKDQLEGKWTDKELGKHFELWDYSEGQVNKIVAKVNEVKKEEFQDEKEDVKVFLATPWTLEHSVAKSLLKEVFEKTILKLREYVTDEKMESKKNEWNLLTNKHERATTTYKFVLNNSISKAVIAQELAEKISVMSDEEKSKLEVDTELEYIIKAIKHVTGGDSDANS
jgi:putative ATP-dependent endonuclease of OLD family